MYRFAQSQRNVPSTLRTAVRWTTLGVHLTDVRRGEVEWRLTKQNDHIMTDTDNIWRKL